MYWWERMPGVVNDKDHIRGFFEDYRWLSNFHECVIHYRGLIFGSTEAAYQAQKTLDEVQKEEFQYMTPKESKKIGAHGVVLRADWDDIKVQMMYEINLEKYTRHEYLKEKLIATGTRHLEETNWWGDQYWGVCKGAGQNQLGKVLMQIREEIKP
jgi:ribA/ribD-fused uncharacterized protein